MKKCSVCLETKPFFSFHRQKSGPGGYRSACKVCRKGEHVDRYEADKVQWNQKAVAWRAANPAKAKLIYKKFREENREQRNAHKRSWVQANRGGVNAYNVKRHTEKLKRTPAWLTDFDLDRIKCLYQLAAMRSRESDQRWHVDHIIPLQGEFVSGLHVPSNLRVIPAVENNRKYNLYEVA